MGNAGREAPNPTSTKKPYGPPVLLKHGDVSTITRNLGGDGNDGTLGSIE